MRSAVQYQIFSFWNYDSTFERDVTALDKKVIVGLTIVLDDLKICQKRAACGFELNAFARRRAGVDVCDDEHLACGDTDNALT